MGDYIYMKVTRDEYELPVAVADTMEELGHILGIRPSSICKLINEANRTGLWSCYRKVYIGEKEN